MKNVSTKNIITDTLLLSAIPLHTEWIMICTMIWSTRICQESISKRLAAYCNPLVHPFVNTRRVPTFPSLPGDTPKKLSATQHWTISKRKKISAWYFLNFSSFNLIENTPIIQSKAIATFVTAQTPEKEAVVALLSMRIVAVTLIAYQALIIRPIINFLFIRIENSDTKAWSWSWFLKPSQKFIFSQILSLRVAKNLWFLPFSFFWSDQSK